MVPDSPDGPYIDAVVAYIDILGFKELVLRESSNGPSLPLRTIRLLQTRLVAPPHEVGQFGAGSLAFSDMVVYWIPVRQVEYLGDEFALDRACIRVAEAQRALLGEGVLVQGGMARGPVYFDSESRTLIGPAFNRAVALAETSAEFPRVAVEPALVTPEVKRRTKEGEWDRMLSFGDGVWFVNYLAPTAFPLAIGGPSWDEWLTHLSNHRDAILKYARTANTPQAQAKVVWARMYHSSYVSAVLNLTESSGGPEIERETSRVRNCEIDDGTFLGALLMAGEQPQAQPAAQTPGPRA